MKTEKIINTNETWFLGIGISQYLSLENLSNNLTDFEEKFKKIYNAFTKRYIKIAVERQYLLENEEATFENIIYKLEYLIANVKPDDNLIIFFYGHSDSHSITSKGYWVPFDANTDKIHLFLRNNTILEYIEEISSLHTLIICDAIFSAPILTNWRPVAQKENYKSRWVLCSGQSTNIISGKQKEFKDTFLDRILEFLDKNTQPEFSVLELGEYVTKNLSNNNSEYLPYYGVINIHGNDGGLYKYRVDEEYLWKRAIEEWHIRYFYEYQSIFPNGSYFQKSQEYIKILKDEELESINYLIDIMDIRLLDIRLELNPETIYRPLIEGSIRHLRLQLINSLNKESPLNGYDHDFFEPLMVLIQRGNFYPGTINSDQNLVKKGKAIKIAKFYLSKYPVSNAEYQVYCLSINKIFGQDNDDPDWLNKPVTGVSWLDAIEYCLWLTQMTGKKYRLPFEAEWEYAARGGILPESTEYAGHNDPLEVAWILENSGGGTHAIGEKAENALGLYDMCGNVWEWCLDTWSDKVFPTFPLDNPTFSPEINSAVIRGGAWSSVRDKATVFSRQKQNFRKQSDDIGFRLALWK